MVWWVFAHTYMFYDTVTDFHPSPFFITCAHTDESGKISFEEVCCLYECGQIEVELRAYFFLSKAQSDV